MKNVQMNKKILLIDIPTYNVTLPNIHRSILEKRLKLQSINVENRTKQKLIRPGLTYSRGLLTIGALLLENRFYVKYLNYSDLDDRSKIFDFAKEFDIVGITSYTATIKLAALLCTTMKQINPQIVTIVGGPHVNSLPLRTLDEFSDIDYVMIGESETRFIDLIMSNFAAYEIPGTAFRLSDGTAAISSGTIPGINLEEIPMPAYQLLTRPLDQYSHNIRTMRGCPYKCKFCVEQSSWNSERKSSHAPEHVLNELRYISERVSEGTLIHFSDTIFNLNNGRIEGILERIKSLDHKLFFSFDTRADLINSDQIRKLSNSGFIYCRIGFENNEETILQDSSKAITVNNQKMASKIIRDSAPNMAIHAYYLTGLPGSTPSGLLRSADYISDLITNNDVDVLGNKIFVPYPGTPYFDNSDHYGIVIQTYDWEKYDRRSYPVYSLKDVDAAEIYLSYLLQESVLLNALGEKHNNHSGQKNVRRDLGYIYSNYANIEFFS